MSKLNIVRSVDLWVVGCGQNIYHVCSRRCGPVDLRTCGLRVVDRIPIIYVAGGVDLWTCGPVGYGLWTEYLS